MGRDNKQRELKKEALKRKSKALNEVSTYGMDLNCDPISIGILMESLGASQKNFFFIERLSRFIDIAINIDIMVFVEHIEQPCTMIRFPLFDLRAFAMYDGLVLVSTVDTCLRALDGPATNIIHYIYDVDFFDRKDLSINQLNRVFNDQRVLTFVRCKDYKKLIETEFDIHICDPIIPNWDFVPMFKTLIPRIREVRNV